MQRPALGALAVAAIACSGCGSSSPTDFTSRADAVCSSAATQLAGANPKHAARYIALVGRITDQLSVLKAPPADRATLAAYVADLRTTQSLITQLNAASQVGDQATMASLAGQLRSLQLKSNSDSAALAALGPKHCGSSPTG